MAFFVDLCQKNLGFQMSKRFFLLVSTTLFRQHVELANPDVWFWKCGLFHYSCLGCFSISSFVQYVFLCNFVFPIKCYMISWTFMLLLYLFIGWVRDLQVGKPTDLWSLNILFDFWDPWLCGFFFSASMKHKLLAYPLNNWWICFTGPLFLTFSHICCDLVNLASLSLS